jgi:hypothetical protein
LPGIRAGARETWSRSEVHVFQIASARGGNAIATDDLWVALIRPGAAWATGIEAIELDVAARAGNGVVLEQSASTSEVGARYSVAFRRVSRKDLPLIPSTVRSREKRELVGELMGGFHASGHRPVLSLVMMKAEVTTWSDGRTAVKCLSVEPLRLEQ